MMGWAVCVHMRYSLVNKVHRLKSLGESGYFIHHLGILELLPSPMDRS